MSQKVTINCVFCNKEFTAFISQKAKYCSSSCAASMRQIGSKLTKECLICHKTFITVKSKNNTYCSSTCRGISRHNRATKECLFCKQAFIVHKHMSSVRNFCSRRCSNDFKSSQSYNLSSFNFESAFGSWFLGWLMTDGHISKRKQVLLSITDKEIIDIIAKTTTYSNKIRTRLPDPKSQLQYTLLFDQDVTRKLMPLGFNCGVKTGFEFIPKNIPTAVFSHFIRGIFEGDGHLFLKGKPNRRFTIVLHCMNKLFLDTLKTKLQDLSIVKRGHICKQRIRKQEKYIYSLKFSINDALSLCNYMYQDSDNLRLTRKYKTYLAAKAMKEIPYD